MHTQTLRKPINAHATYVERCETIELQIQALRDRLVTHAKAESANPQNWGYAGDLSQVSGLLAQAIEGI